MNAYLHRMVVENKQTNRNSRLGMLLVAFGLFVYVFMRAYLLSMTHDEAHTYLAFHDISVWSCFWSADCWENANNHLLNTLLMQGSVAIFGPTEWAIRLPNVFAYGLYLWVSMLIVRKLAPNHPGLQWLGFILMNANPYLLDFFSLARGYGLSVSCMLTALWFYLRWLQDKRIGFIGLAYVWLGLSVMSNFTALNILAAFLISHAIIGLVGTLVDKSVTWRQLFLSALPAIGLLVLLAFLLALPIQELKQKGEFLYGAASLWDTITILVADTLYSQHYVGSATVNTGLVMMMILLMPALAYGLGVYVLRLDLLHRFLLAVVLMLLGSLSIMLVQHELLGSQFLFNRKALLYIPLLGLILWLFIAGNWDRSWMKITGGVVGIFLVYHELRSANLNSCREWWYDANTKTMMLSLAEVTKDEAKPVSLGLNWLFMPASEYYRTVYHLDFLEPLIYDKSIQADGRFDYYYIDGGDWPQLEEKYDKIQDYGGRYLVRRKSND